jgi:23S rRNA (pseudouridine1915-N3)-methyltransferase
LKIKIICIGKTSKKFLVEGEQEYLDRLKHYVIVERIEIPDIKNAKNLSIEQIKVLEGKEILSRIATTEQVFLLDENGKNFSSKEFSVFFQQKFNQSGKGITFVIGGAFGFSEAVYTLANSKISLSRMTFSHQMIRMIFVEQVYRAMTILKGEGYHHE